MKMKKITAFIVAILSILTIASYAPVAKVSAANNDGVKFVHGYSAYSLEFVLGKYLTEETLKAENVNYGYAYKTGSEEFCDVITSAHVFSGSVDATYDIEIYTLGKDDEGNATKDALTTGWIDGVEHSFTLITKTTEADLYYSVTAEALDKYKAAIRSVDDEGKETGKLAGKTFGDSFTIPELNDILVSNYFDYAALKSNLTLYYCKPNSSSFSSTSSKSFTLDQIGVYSFYVLAKDPTGTAMTLDTEALERKADGWYENDKLIVPIFSFYFDKVTGPKITITPKKKVEEGYVGLNYQDAKSYITIVANNETVRYELWYSTSDLSIGDEWNNISEEDLKAKGAVNVTEDEEIAFNASSLYFTPNKTGSYYVFVTVADDFGEARAVTYAINVNSGFNKVKYDTQFLKHNWLSIMFLGIALLSLIGIILLIFVKPKEEVEEEVTVVEKK